jgi:hypothetical protein
MRRIVRDLALCSGLFAAVTATATAQQATPAPTEKWEESAHLSGMMSTNPSGGTFTPPPVNPSLAIATGGLGPRISSWFFGDGAKLLDDVNAQLGSSLRVASLDGLFGSSMIQNGSKMAFGFRVARVLTPRLAAELSLDYSPGGIRASESAAGSLRRARDTFAAAMRQALAVGGAFPPPVTTASAMGPGTGGQRLTTGALKVALPSIGRATPFVVGGAGVASRSGDLPGGSINANYAGFFGSSTCDCRMNERNELRVRLSAPTRERLAIMGIGVDYQPTVTFWRGSAENRSRWGVRVEARVYLGGTRSETFVETSHSFVKGEPDPDVDSDFPVAGVLVLGTSPAAQFSNDPAVTGFDSSLSGQPLTNFRVFEGSGMRTRVAITTGLFVRF